MSNFLIFKAKPTLSVDSVETDLTNYEISNEYTTFTEITTVVAHTSGTAVLPTPSTLPTTPCFIELISDQELTITFKLTSGATLTTLTKVKYLAGHFLAWAYTVSNTGTTDANIIFRIYY